MFNLLFIQQFEELYYNPFHPFFILNEFLEKFRKTFNLCNLNNDSFKIKNIIKFLRHLSDFNS